jgi:hypothetical protein
VPTTRPRHTITETPPVQEALDELRAKLNGEELAEWIRSGTGPKLDITAAEEVKYLGQIANYDE